ncbi:hypothetical protein E3N88_19666 [Mikania micrantha]|uniref:Uncharacterized protein n=1 Tax=Mikania micrantha TaxID=192012 RepID=A0A5N6NQI7_9ASTR|nr:hypothetical protein E3N88_19666 [Mikania micrantha]
MPVEVSPEEIRDQVVDDENVTVVPSPMTAAVDRLLKTMTGMDACVFGVCIDKDETRANFQESNDAIESENGQFTP